MSSINFVTRPDGDVCRKAIRELRRFDRMQWMRETSRKVGFQLFGLFLLVCAGNQVRELVWWLLS